METLKLFSTIFILSGIYLYTLNEDYQNTFDKPSVVSYNCDMLIGSWHPDIPVNVIEECRKLRNAKTY